MWEFFSSVFATWLMIVLAFYLLFMSCFCCCYAIYTPFLFRFPHLTIMLSMTISLGGKKRRGWRCTSCPNFSSKTSFTTSFVQGSLNTSPLSQAYPFVSIVMSLSFRQRSQYLLQVLLVFRVTWFIGRRHQSESILGCHVLIPMFLSSCSWYLFVFSISLYFLQIEEAKDYCLSWSSFMEILMTGDPGTLLMDLSCHPLEMFSSLHSTTGWESLGFFLHL